MRHMGIDVSPAAFQGGWGQLARPLPLLVAVVGVVVVGVGLPSFLPFFSNSNFSVRESLQRFSSFFQTFLGATENSKVD